MIYNAVVKMSGQPTWHHYWVSVWWQKDLFTHRYVSAKEFEKLSKYMLKNLQIEVERMWKLKATIVPVVIGALGVISKNVQKHIDKLPGTTWLAKRAKYDSLHSWVLIPLGWDAVWDCTTLYKKKLNNIILVCDYKLNASF